MSDRSLADKPEVELDAELIGRILEEGDNYAGETLSLAQLIVKYGGYFRERLIETNRLQIFKERTDGFELAAVDGASAVAPHGGGTLVVAAAYKATLSDEKQRGDARVVLLPNSPSLEAFATLLRVHLELELLSSDKLDTDRLVILDHSFWGLLQAVSRGLAAYKSQRTKMLSASQEPTNSKMQHQWLLLFRSCLGRDGSLVRMIRNKQVLSLSKTGMSQSVVNALFTDQFPGSPEEAFLGTALNDRVLLRHILRPGEYTTPQTVYQSVREQSKIKSWNRSRFVTDFDELAVGMSDPFEARDEVFDEFGLPDGNGQEPGNKRLFVSYFRPYSWSRVLRIEYHQAMLFDREGGVDMFGSGERFQRLLASVKRSMSRETKEPLAQVLADQRASSAVASTISMLPERAFYQLREMHRDNPDLLAVVDSLVDEERT